MVVKCSCHCAYTNENSDNGNQKAILNKNHLKRTVEPIYKIISKVLDYDEFCTNKAIRRKFFGK